MSENEKRRDGNLFEMPVRRSRGADTHHVAEHAVLACEMSQMQYARCIWAVAVKHNRTLEKGDGQIKEVGVGKMTATDSIICVIIVLQISFCVGLVLRTHRWHRGYLAERRAKRRAELIKRYGNGKL